MPDPLHPALVHLPLGIAFLQPLLVVLAIVAIAKKWIGERVWVGIVLLQALLFVSALVAKETGEEQVPRVEATVPAEALTLHEDRADQFALCATIALICAALGLFTKRLGWVAKGLTAAVAVVVLIAAVAVGGSGGSLVYEHGAAQVYWQK